MLPKAEISVESSEFIIDSLEYQSLEETDDESLLFRILGDDYNPRAHYHDIFHDLKFVVLRVKASIPSELSSKVFMDDLCPFSAII